MSSFVLSPQSGFINQCISCMLVSQLLSCSEEQRIISSFYLLPSFNKICCFVNLLNASINHANGTPVAKKKKKKQSWEIEKDVVSKGKM